MTDAAPPPLLVSRFAELLDSYGGDLARWPELDRVRAEALLRTDADARRLHEDALRLDAQLDAFELPELSPQLRSRVLEIPIRHPHAPRRYAWFSGMRLGMLAVVPCLLGFLGGAWMTDPNDTDEGWNEVTSVSLLSDIGDLGDLGDEDVP
jgi:hypothetical protein